MRGATVAGSNTTMSAAMPSRSRPRSWKPNWVAVSQVIIFTASSSVKACLSRTQWLSRWICSEESMICETWAPESEKVRGKKECEATG